MKIGILRVTSTYELTIVKYSETNDKYSVFTYFITPDYDFKQDVLSFGDKVEVLEPKELREEMKEIVKKLNKIYNNYGKINI